MEAGVGSGLPRFQRRMDFVCLWRTGVTTFRFRAHDVKHDGVQRRGGQVGNEVFKTANADQRNSGFARLFCYLLRLAQAFKVPIQ